MLETHPRSVDVRSTSSENVSHVTACDRIILKKYLFENKSQFDPLPCDLFDFISFWLLWTCSFKIGAWASCQEGPFHAGGQTAVRPSRVSGGPADVRPSITQCRIMYYALLAAILKFWKILKYFDVKIKDWSSEVPPS